MPESICDAEAAAEVDAQTADADMERTEIDPQRLPRPDETQPLKILWDYTVALIVVHLIALFAVVPWCFTWSGLILAVVGYYLFGMMGIAIGYHRLLTHRGFSCPKWFEHTLAILGVCCLQDSPARWVAIHRMHHQHSDHQPDPHTPLVSFIWSHFGWIVCRHRDLDRTSHYERYVRDLLRDPFYLRLERSDTWFLIYIGHAIAITIAGALFGFVVSGGIVSDALQYAVSWAVWGVAVRTVFELHCTWSVNSLAHTFGYRNYDTREHSTNNWLVAFFAHGEGWHNNHHAEPRAAIHGHRWWEFDMSWKVLQLLQWCGIVSDIVLPKAMQKSEPPK